MNRGLVKDGRPCWPLAANRAPSNLLPARMTMDGYYFEYVGVRYSLRF